MNQEQMHRRAVLASALALVGAGRGEDAEQLILDARLPPLEWQKMRDQIYTAEALLQVGEALDGGQYDQARDFARARGHRCAGWSLDEKLKKKALKLIDEADPSVPRRKWW